MHADDDEVGGLHGAVPVEGWVEISAVSGTFSLGLMMGGQPGPCAVHADDSGEGGGHTGHAVPGEGEVDTSVMSGTSSQEQVVGGQPECHSVHEEDGEGVGRDVTGQRGVDTM